MLRKVSPNHHNLPQFAFLILAFFTLTSLLGCPKKPGQFDSLVNQGLLPVSSDNPFVGPNLFLGREMEKSAYLLNFFRSKGAPQAIELYGDEFETAELKLFYASKREVYVASPTVDKKVKTKEWIIRGPYAIGRDYHREVNKLPVMNQGVFEVYGTREYFGGAAAAQNSVQLQPVFVPTPRPTPRPILRKKPTPNAKDLTPTPPPAPSPMNFDQRALLEAQQKANAPALPTPPTLLIVTSAPGGTSSPESAKGTEATPHGAPHAEKEQNKGVNSNVGGSVPHEGKTENNPGDEGKHGPDTTENPQAAGSHKSEKH